ncbi:hypothetical protein PsYK624_023330 [Phanerochaete sordida]|uniref:Uncharacterized protein n=1 Tax=Phanerochaete sordida TaxID=48140 RepID=A0A9P3FZQ8_9APHY|nr:hypothetical protein PsYK624_023330 [Phanerochaete sordida]
MSRRPLVPFLVAGIAGVMSGVYIFKPLVDNSTTVRSLDRSADADKTAADGSSAASDGHTSTVTAGQTKASPGANEAQQGNSTKP